MRINWCIPLALAAATACRGKPQGALSGGQQPSAEQPAVPTAPPRTLRDSALAVTPSPQAASEVELPEGAALTDLAGWTTRAGAVVLLADSEGPMRVASWEAGSGALTPVATLPVGFSGTAIATHPAGSALFVAGAIAGESRILALEPSGGTWRDRVVFRTPRPIGRLIVGPRPFETDNGQRYRLFFAAKLADGSASLRTVTDTGTIEYQVVGPDSTVVKFQYEQPGGVIAGSGIPMGFHPRGEPLLWQDRRGCAHVLPYDYRYWGVDSTLTTVPCGATVTFMPNGAAYMVWRSGTPGIQVVFRDTRRATTQATDYTFLSAPVPTPDGKGIIGVASKGALRRALVFVPVSVPLADVANAWQTTESPCDVPLFATNAGLFREQEPRGQLFSLYESENYGTQYPRPFLVTTDLLLDNFGAAFNGVFILLERHLAEPAFRSFVGAADEALRRSSPGSRWSKAFAAIADVLQGRDSGEAGRILHSAGQARSTVLDSAVNYAEFVPRGHYTATPEMRRYFSAVHYLTTVSRAIDPAPLQPLPSDVRRKAGDWIAVYKPFIAPPRAPLIWAGVSAGVAPYAKHPWDHASVFPLAWGIDNEVLESSVFHRRWPLAEQIGSDPDGPWRTHPSGLDVAAMFGNALARALLDTEFVTFPRLKPVLDGIAARRPAPSASMSLYERWLDALGTSWADSSAIPGTAKDGPVWRAKRLQTGLASWATLREATILVTERPEAAEAGEGGFEELITAAPRGYVEPSPRAFDDIADLFDALARTVSASPLPNDGGGAQKLDEFRSGPLRTGILKHLDASAAVARRFAKMAEEELRNQPLSDSDYDAIRSVGGTVEHEFLIFQSLAEKDLALSVPEPLPRIADVAGSPDSGLLEVAVGGPMEWDQIVPFFGRREIVIGSVYSYYEFLSQVPYDNTRWRAEVADRPHPAWIQPLVAPTGPTCRARASR